MNTLNTFFFDLDGTLTDSEPGIVNSVRYALDAFGLKFEASSLRRFIGPPLYDSLTKECGFGHEDALRAIALYRDYFQDKGIFENTPYPGVLAMLKKLQAAGHKLCIATSKPEVFARRIADHFAFSPHLCAVYGADLEGKRSAKTEVIRYALAEQGTDPAQVLMIGDREYDILGAHACSLSAWGVLYGYGSQEELSKAGADRLVATVAELERELLAL